MKSQDYPKSGSNFYFYYSFMSMHMIEALMIHRDKSTRNTIKLSAKEKLIKIYSDIVSVVF